MPRSELTWPSSRRRWGPSAWRWRSRWLTTVCWPERTTAYSGCPRRSHTCPFVRTFAEGQRGELLIYEDAYRRLAVAVRHGDAARRLGAGVDDELWLRAA